MSLNAYSDGAPTDALSDIAIKPRPGHTNPFIPGALRDCHQALLPGPGAQPAAALIGLAAGAEHALRAARPRRLDRAALPGVRARPRPRPHGGHRAAAAGAQDGGREHGEGRRRLRGDQRPRPLDPGADRARGDLAGRALDPALRPADEPGLRPAALGALLQPELRAARRGQRLHRRGPAGPARDGSRRCREASTPTATAPTSTCTSAATSAPSSSCGEGCRSSPARTRAPRACPTRSFASGRSAPASRGSRPAPPTASPTTRSSTAAAATTRSWSVAARTAHPTRARDAAWPGSTGGTEATAPATETTGS